MTNYTIRLVEDQDLPVIASISSELALSPVTMHNPTQGFLVSGFTVQQYKQFKSSTQLFWVAEVDGNVAGFILAYPSEKIAPDETVNNIVKYGSYRDFILIKQIAVSPKYMRQGVATKLYRHLMEQQQGNDFVAAIVTEPENAGSIEFHEKLGFQHIVDVDPPEDCDGMVRPRGIWLKPHQGWQGLRFALPDHEVTIARLFEKQHDLIALYLHEDNLNWTKFEHLVGYMLAHFAGLAFLIENKSDGYALVGAAFLILTGYLTLYLFHKKLASGTRFMATHKAKLIEVENRISTFDKTLPRCLGRGNGTKQTIDVRKQSSTVNILKWIPTILATIWSAMSIFAVLYMLGIVSG